MFAVPQMVRWVLRLGLTVLWMDTDVIALADPFPVIHAQMRAGSGGDVDGVHRRGAPLLLASVDGRVPDENLRECTEGGRRGPRKLSH